MLVIGADAAGKIQVARDFTLVEGAEPGKGGEDSSFFVISTDVLCRFESSAHNLRRQIWTLQQFDKDPGVLVVSTEFVGGIEKRHALSFVFQVVLLGDREQNLCEAVVGADLITSLIESFHQQRRRQSGILEQFGEVHLANIVGLKFGNLFQNRFGSALLQQSRYAGGG